ncbi:MAG: hypothetical protein JOZ73_05465 [Solirubrobacterales bacterium]|nr:hypothetical protein [Solirubrobacterales bacterium]
MPLRLKAPQSGAGPRGRKDRRRLDRPAQGFAEVLEDGQCRGGADLLAGDVQRESGKGILAGSVPEHAPEGRVGRAVAGQEQRQVFVSPRERDVRGLALPDAVRLRGDRRHRLVNLAMGSPT